ncbi:TlpA family protein disulfide reductase [Niabella drilacis]|uniref:AhpC/TSA family protein n=1 Tax=Niabella drilacis (strain DSM 25811 / CCM 8410 / CCUG 62505 / LMG 26954 / E90) TaxID=1285928 RepID=A0A1G6ZSZ9_NIADE|nr:TlpA disulfide reductase family protein [Niabella drilacis]SDE05808.1 AhpC/TSA family protein [Niabella drilacis]
MKRSFIVLIPLFLWACNNAGGPVHTDNGAPAGSNEVLPDEDFFVDPGKLLEDHDSWYDYTYYNVHLSGDFMGLDADSVPIGKGAFLRRLMTGDVVAFKIKRYRGMPVYKLYPLTGRDEAIRSTSRQLASIEMKNFKMEGMRLPEFAFTDLRGQTYNTGSTKGKLLVLKCWFIHCLACVREFPECNALVEEYKNRNNLLFISLASDKKNDLEKFLSTRELEYAVIPEMDAYMSNKLNITMYPTHLLVGTDGKILKVVQSVKELQPFLEKEMKKTADQKKW